MVQSRQRAESYGKEKTRLKDLKHHLLALLTVLSLSVEAFAQHDTSPMAAFMWHETDRKIVLGQIDKEEAEALLKEYQPKVRRYFMKAGGVNVLRQDWVYPLDKFSSVTYRDDGKDYRQGGYDYFQGTNSKGHPAHDIMILDADKNSLDDSTGNPVDVVSMSSGVVVSVDTSWYPGSKLRGGRYVKIFDVTNNGLFYYSHLSVVSVSPGTVVNAGDKIGEVGRTGRKTILPEGKTHLHVAFLKFKDGYPVPEEIIQDIFRAEKKRIQKTD